MARVPYPERAAANRTDAMMLCWVEIESSEPVVPPEAPVLLGQLLSSVAVPERLVEEADQGLADLMIDHRGRQVSDVGARLHRPKVEIDVLGGDEPGIEAM